MSIIERMYLLGTSTIQESGTVNPHAILMTDQSVPNTERPSGIEA